MEGNPRKKNQKKQSKFAIWFKWPLIALIISFTVSMAFGVLSEIALSNASIAISIVVILVFLFISVITDMVGVAIASCDEKPFRAMDARKIRGAKESIRLVKNADKVSSIFADILGDICGILSGAAGATVTAAFIRDSMSPILTVVIASLVSAVIAALIISGKALMKRYSMLHCEKIILILGKILSIFHLPHRKNNKNKNVKESKKNIEKEELDSQKSENNTDDNQKEKIDATKLNENSENKDTSNREGNNDKENTNDKEKPKSNE